MNKEEKVMIDRKFSTKIQRKIKDLEEDEKMKEFLLELMDHETRIYGVPKKHYTPIIKSLVDRRFKE